jgi:hypothetical protein
MLHKPSMEALSINVLQQQQKTSLIPPGQDWNSDDDWHHFLRVCNFESDFDARQ